MTPAQRTGGLRLLLALLPVVLTLVVSTLAVAPQAGAARAAQGGDAAYDRSLRTSDCDLLGRDFERGLGCARKGCTFDSVPFRKVYGAEACALEGQPKGYGYVATVPAAQCRALGRRWIAEVNYCASVPDRSVSVLYDAPQCTGSASVYVPLREVDGYYDECLTFQRTTELIAAAEASGTTLQQQVELRSAVQCGHRPRHAFRDGTCVEDPSVPLASGGVLLIGDSLSWRGSDELARVQPGITVDAEPARPATELAARLAAYRAGHEEPAGLVIELGTVPAPGFTRADLARAVASVPATTKVMLVLPHFEVRTDPVVVSPQSTKVGGWMRALAGSRQRTCVADWPAYVARHRGILADGVHTKHAAEGQWARWLAGEWKHC
jgi:hypothetical protein